jgi:hypothetical protein
VISTRRCPSPFCTSSTQWGWQLSGQIYWAWRSSRLASTFSRCGPWIFICRDAWWEILSRKFGIAAIWLIGLRWLLQTSYLDNCFPERLSSTSLRGVCSGGARTLRTSVVIMYSTVSECADKSPPHEQKITHKEILWNDDWKILQRAEFAFFFNLKQGNKLACFVKTNCFLFCKK